MKNLFSTLPILALVVLASCGSPDPRNNEPNYDALAEDLCNCLRPMFELQDELMQKMTEGKEEEIMAMTERAMQVQADGEACVAELEKKHGVIEGEEKEAKATEALRKACPDIVAMMEGAMEPEILEEIPMEELEEALQGEGEQ